MKTRIIHTKIWEDDKVMDLSLQARYLFLYYLTNHRINLCGLYELNDRTTSYFTGIPKLEIPQLQKEIEDQMLMHFYDGWIYSPKSQKLGGYGKGKSKPAMEEELARTPKHVMEYFSSLGYTIPLSIPLYIPPINHKPEIRNHKEEDKEISIEDIDF